MTNELSLQARGALAYFRENPDVEITPQAVQELGVGHVVSYRILNELILAGYMIRHHNRKEDGDYVPVKYELVKHLTPSDLTESVSRDKILSTS